MAIMVKKLYKNGTFLYKMKLVAGRNGLSNLVRWVHIIEDDSVSSFLHGNELVFTAGILNHSPDWLLNFSHKLHGAGVSAFVVNIGPHTREIPKEVISYCDEVSMPLFTIPWEIKMVDMTRDFCHRIMNNEHAENTIASTVKNIIFNVGDFDAQVLQIERYGYQRDSKFCFVGVDTSGKSGVSIEEHLNALAIIAEKIAKNMQELFVSFTYKECLILVLVNYSDAEIGGFVQSFLGNVRAQASGPNLYMGISSNQTGVYNQNANFEKALSAMEMAKKRKEAYRYYDELGIYKVLYAVPDKSVLRGFYNDVLGKLETYDRENSTGLMALLRTYLENNGSLQLVSEKLFVHRNTVTNQLKKIEKIIGYDPLDLEDKVKLYMGLCIKDILK